jgi:predicted DNA-binding transcriptional regulator YafY
MSIETRPTRAELLALLRQGQALTLSEMTECLPIDSKRQVRRHLNRLREAGVSIQEEARGREKVFFLPPEELEVVDAPVSLTERQALALVVAAEAGRAALAPTPLAEPLEAGFGKLLDRLDRASGTYDLGRLREQWHFGTEPAASTFDGDAFDTLVKALNEGRPVRIAYEPAHASDAPRKRTISPLMMAAPGGSWRCVAYCHYREAPRDFTLSRIEDITLLTDDVAIRPDDFDADLYFHERFGALGGETRVVRLLVEPDAARYFREKSYHSSQVVEEERDDGRLVVSFEVEGLEDMTSWVQSWGLSVKVLDPPELAERIAEEARRVAARYDDAPEGTPTPDTDRPES